MPDSTDGRSNRVNARYYDDRYIELVFLTEAIQEMCEDAFAKCQRSIDKWDKIVIPSDMIDRRPMLEVMKLELQSARKVLDNNKTRIQAIMLELDSDDVTE